MSSHKKKLDNFLSRKPNIMIIINDQQRTRQHWPVSWEEEHLPNMKRLKDHGLTFQNSFTVACACSASRASMLTGTYPSQHGVKNTLPMVNESYGGTNPGGMPLYLNELRPTDPNLASMLNAEGYHSVWKGKWHLTLPRDGATNWTEEDIDYMRDAYGFDGWNPNDAGNSESDPQSFGGGFAQNDDRYVSGIVPPGDNSPKAESLLDFLDHHDPKKGRPFFLVASLVNPHDVWAAPTFLDSFGYNDIDIPDYDLGYPSTTAEQDLYLQPEIQNYFKQIELAGDLQNIEDAQNMNIGFKGSPLNHELAYKRYVNFYAYLQTLADKQVGKILDKLDEKHLTKDTLIIRMADHGEMGVSHGLREKEFVAYDEAIKIPLIFSNPLIWDKAEVSTAMVSNVDIAPTLADIVGVMPYYSSTFKGRSIRKFIEQPYARDDREYIHYMTDDSSPANGASYSDKSSSKSSAFFIKQKYGHPNFLRAIRSHKWMYCVTFLELPMDVYDSTSSDCLQYEMYDLTADHLQQNNLAGDPDYADQQKILHEALHEEMRKNQTIPRGFILPSVALKVLVEATTKMDDKTNTQSNNGSPIIGNNIWPTADEAISTSHAYRENAITNNNQ